MFLVIIRITVVHVLRTSTQLLVMIKFVDQTLLDDVYCNAFCGSAFPKEVKVKLSIVIIKALVR